MKSKFLLLATILVTLVLTTLVSAAANFTVSPATIALTKGTNSENITITNSVATPLTLTIPASAIISGENGDSISIALTGSVSGLAQNAKSVINVIRSDPTDWKNFQIGKIYQTSVVLKETGNEINNVTATIQIVNGFCKQGTVGGNLTISGVEDRTKDNEDEWVWHPLDNIQIRANDVCSNFDKDKTVKVEYALYDSSGKKVDLGDSTYQSISIKDSDCEDVTFDFKIPADIDNGDYKLFVKAYIKSDETINCVDKIGTIYFQSVSVEKANDRDIVVDMTDLDSTFEHTTSCNSDITLDANIYNIGDNDEDKVLVNIYNKELGIDFDEVLTDLSIGDNTLVSFNFNIPQNATEKTYTLELRTYYDYNSDNSACVRDTDIACYDQNSEDDADRQFTTSLKVSGLCNQASKGDVSITAQLVTAEESVKAGNEVKIKATLKNVGIETTTYTIGLTGYEDWSTLVSVSPQSITLIPGESKNVDITLKLNNDASGDQTFNVKALFGTNSKEKLLSLSIQAGPSFNLPGIFKDNKMLFWIVVINIILIVLIIIVAVKVARS